MIKLQEIYKKYSGPLGVGDKGTAHSYIDVYENLFFNLQNKNINVLEIGVLEGHSIKMWKEYFTNASIYGCDIHDKSHLNLEDDRTTIICNDATKPETFKDIDNLDIIIDDGSHILIDQINSFKILKSKLTNNSFYIIEDVQSANVAPIQDEFNNTFEVLDMRNLRIGLDDNILMVYRNDK